MPKNCNVCTNKEKNKINVLLLEGTSVRKIGKSYKISPSSVWRHKQKHLPNDLSKTLADKKDILAKIDEQELPKNDLGSHLKCLYKQAIEILNKSKEKNEFVTALKAITEARNCLNLAINASDFLYKKKEKSEIKLKDILKVITKALEPYQEARLAVASALDKKISDMNTRT